MKSSPKKENPKMQLIKLFVQAEDIDRIRLAAAVMRLRQAEFVRSIVVAEAKRITSKIEFPKS